MNSESRYRDVDTLLVSSHDYDDVGNIIIDPVTNRPTVNYPRETSYRLTTLPLPDPPVNQYMVKVTDNYTLLAKTVYNDAQKWWVLADANPHIRHPLDLKAADIIFLP